MLEGAEHEGDGVPGGRPLQAGDVHVPKTFT